MAVLLLGMLLGLHMLAASSASAEEVQATPSFGGPDAVPRQIQSDVDNSRRSAGTGVGERWDRWKSGLQSRHGLGLGIDYTSVYQNASDTVPGGDDEAAAGMLRFYGSWDLIGRDSANTGTFIWKVEHRHDYGDPPPSPLWAATELGYVGLENAPFSDQGSRTTNLYWRQRFNGGRQSTVVGFIDVTDFVDLYGLVSPWLHFTNFFLPPVAPPSPPWICPTMRHWAWVALPCWAVISTLSAPWSMPIVIPKISAKALILFKMTTSTTSRLSWAGPVARMPLTSITIT